jgi:hypothetical protein
MFRASLNQTKLGTYRASVNTFGRTERLGRYTDPVRAALAILTAASRYMEELTNTQVSSMLAEPSLPAFLSTVAHYSPGDVMRLSEFCERFWAYLPSDQRDRWTKPRIIACLPPKFPFGAHTGNQRCIGNIAWSAALAPSKIVVVDNGRLKLIPFTV